MLSHVISIPYFIALHFHFPVRSSRSSASSWRYQQPSWMSFKTTPGTDDGLEGSYFLFLSLSSKPPPPPEQFRTLIQWLLATQSARSRQFYRKMVVCEQSRESTKFICDQASFFRGQREVSAKQVPFTLLCPREPLARGLKTVEGGKGKGIAICGGKRPRKIFSQGPHAGKLRVY